MRLTVIHQGQALFFEAPGPASAAVPLPANTLAACAGEDEVCLLRASGEVQRLTTDGTVTTLRRVELPVDLELAAISGNGALVLVSTRSGKSCRVLREEQGQWMPVDTPEWFRGVNGLSCAADGQSFAYAYVTEQPYSEDGSYGHPLAGVAVFSANGAVLAEEWDVRERFEEPPRVRLAWGLGGEPLVESRAYTAQGDGDVSGHWGRSVGGPLRSGPGDVPLCDAEAPPELYDVHSARAGLPTVSPDGDRAGALDMNGDAWVFERSSRRRCRMASDAIAIDLRKPSLLGWVTRERVWRREPPSSFEWEAVS
ncbi:hypothetical protein JY651_23260 [Pyxidicoccus parkwayensis]|uniref:Lipoprotein n=1 Tax=Pyxidicoccus parkwayensis TaxID=2813578 RepID=A0ABX7PAX4_9BACT|nr:hypothetical protein [Pyxidicoccus parkwaysis]QSQ27649.1 hypothetical protein JY651_23260 [Pyxidicoccus parkwaysis]